MARARIFVEPRQIERLIAASPQPNQASEPRIPAMLERYLAAVDYAGAALVWNESGIVVNMVELLIRRSWTPGSSTGPRVTIAPKHHDFAYRRQPLALASGHLDVRCAL